jgi:hypothetical protein
MAVAAHPVMNSIRANTRVVRVSLGESLEKAKTTWGVRALQVAAFAATLIPVIGLGATYMIDRQKNAVVADNQKEVLAKHYRHQIAAVVGVRPDRVTKTDLELAKGNAVLSQATQKVDAERNSANRSAAFALGGAGALSWFVPLPLVGTVAHTVSKLAVDATGAVAGGMVSSLFDKDILHAHDMVVHLNDKQARGEQIAAEDIVMLRISQNEPLQQQLKKANGRAFHKMTPAEQRAIVVGMPEMLDAQTIAQQVNTTPMTIEDVLMAKKPQRWADRVGGSRAAQGSFMEQQRARAAASTQGFAPSM